MPTRDEAKRLLDHLEGRFEALGPEHPNANRVRDNLARLLPGMRHAGEASAHSQAAEASHKKVLGSDHYWSKDSAGLSNQRQRIVGGNEGPPLPPPKLSMTANGVGNETKDLARSKLEKAQQPSLHPTPNPPLAKAETTEIRRKFEKMWTLYEEREKSEAQACRHRRVPWPAQHAPHRGVQRLGRPLGDVARLVNLAARDRRIAAEAVPDRLGDIPEQYQDDRI
jgi:hypothetical protein